MQYYTDIYEYCETGKCAITLGKFDGLHRGHQKLIDKVQQRAEEKQIKSVVFAFDMGKQSLLTNAERRAHLETHVDCIIQCPFTKEIKEMEAEAFIQQILVTRLHACHIVVGADFCFGHGKRGDVEMLASFAKCGEFHLDVIEKERDNGKEISSTFVREALRQGNIEVANKFLGYPYHLSGLVEHGKKLGRTLGFPTLNIAPAAQKIVPKHGVYACRIKLEGNSYQGIGNVGTKPTVSKEMRVLTEVYVFDFEEEVYGKQVEIEFLFFLRPEMNFHSIAELKEQVDADILYGREYFKSS